MLNLLNLPEKFELLRGSYNDHQRELYARAVLGLAYYSLDIQNSFCSQKRRRIKKVHARAMDELNKLKQTRLHLISGSILTLFCKKVKPGSVLEYLILVDEEPDEDFICTLPMSYLDISQKDLINHWIGKGILPNNFYSSNCAKQKRMSSVRKKTHLEK